MMGLRHWQVDIDELRVLWDADWSAEELSEKFRCTQSMIYTLAQKYGFRKRDALRSSEPSAAHACQGRHRPGVRCDRTQALARAV